MANEIFIRELGRGGFGYVAAVQISDGSTLARKVFNTSRERDEELHSFQLLHNQQHPCIISALKSGTWKWNGAPVPYIDYPIMQNR